MERPTIGVELLKMLMLQLYSDPRCIYREYIQNAMDSIHEAVKKGILESEKDGHVAISINQNDITIEDNGIGISHSDAVKVLSDIANSSKNGIDTAGQFGIGRLSGGGYCNKLVFETTYKGEDDKTVVTFDISELRRLTDSPSVTLTAEEAIMYICSSETIPACNDEHSFTVRLLDIIYSKDILLNVEGIVQYVKEYAPIGYSTIFNAMINSSEQEEYKKRHKQIEAVKVSINDKTDIQKGYTDIIMGSNDQIHKLRYFELPEHPKFGKLGWGWYAVTDFSVQINDTYAGIRLRKHNISLNKTFIDHYFKENRGNKYFYGEIFVTNENIVPDSGRSGLAASEEADALKQALGSYCVILKKVYHKANDLKNAIKKIAEILDKIESTELESAKVILKKQLIDYVKSYEKEVELTQYDEINDVINVYVKKYNEKIQYRIVRLMPEAIPSAKATASSSTNLVQPSPQPILQQPQFTSLQSVRPHQPAPHHIQQPFQPTETSIKTSNSRVPIPNSTKQKTKTSPNDDKNNEICTLLLSKGYEKDTISVISKLFTTILATCPRTNQATFIALMEAAVQQLPQQNEC